MQNVTFKDRLKKRLGMKTQDEKVEDGLRSLRDLFDKIGEHDLAMIVDDMLVNGSMAGKCVMAVSLTQIIPLLVATKIYKKKGILDD